MGFSDPRALPFLLVGGLLLLGVLFAVVRNLAASRWLLLAMFFVAGLAPGKDNLGETNNTFLRPLQTGRAEIYTALSGFLLVGLFFHAKRLSARGIPPQGVMLLLINVYAGLLDIKYYSAGDGIGRILLAATSIISIVLIVPVLLRAIEDYLDFFRYLGFAAVAWAVACAIQTAIAPNEMFTGAPKRFIGLLGNPQSTAVFLGPMASIALFLALNEHRPRLKKLWILTTIVYIVFVLGSGSRTGTLMTIFGFLGVLYARLGTGILFAPPLILAVWGLVAFLQAIGIELPITRITEGGDTRTEVWKLLLEDALNAPILGEGVGSHRAVENSYLLGTIVYGKLMFLFLMALMAVAAYQVLRLRALRASQPPLIQRVIDLHSGYTAMYFVGGIFEWYIIARIDINLPLMVMFGCVGSAIIRDAADREWIDGESLAYPQFEPGAPAQAEDYYSRA